MTTLTKPKHQWPLLALDAGTQSTGWAVFGPGDEIVTSTIAFPRQQLGYAGLSHSHSH